MLTDLNADDTTVNDIQDSVEQIESNLEKPLSITYTFGVKTME